MKKHASFTLCLFLLIIGMPVFADQDTHQAINHAIKNFVYDNLSANPESRIAVEIGHLDSRLQLKPCNKKLAVFIPPGQSLQRMSIAGIRCDDLPPWKLFVPIEIKMLTQVLTTRVPLSRNQIIQKQDITLTEKNIYQMRQGFYQNENDVVGMKTKFSMTAGTIISPRNISEPILVKKGDHVSIQIKKNNISIKMKGIAQKNGSLNEQIPVKNISSNRVVQAIIKERGLVEIN